MRRGCRPEYTLLDDFIEAVENDRDPSVTGQEVRNAVELFTAIYRSGRDGKTIQFPLQPEIDRDDFDGRLSEGRLVF